VRVLSRHAPNEQVSEVKNIMMENIEKVLDRGEKLEVRGCRTAAVQPGGVCSLRSAAP